MSCGKVDTMTNPDTPLVDFSGAQAVAVIPDRIAVSTTKTSQLGTSPESGINVVVIPNATRAGDLELVSADGVTHRQSLTVPEPAAPGGTETAVPAGSGR